MTNETDKTASRFLGKKVSGSEKYDSGLLVRVLREENRKQYHIENKSLPFEGYDVWHAYEFSCMTENGLPVTRLMKLRYNCNNEYLVESKSLKLYLNSFNMSCFGKTTTECLSICKNLIEKDLSETLETPVNVNFLDNGSECIEIFKDFKNIMDFVDETSLRIEKFKEAPEVLEVEQTPDVKEYRMLFDSVRSNCRVTHQPDFGDAFICYKSDLHIKEDSLVKYLSSFRKEFHFHEECCEMIYKRLYDLLGAGCKLFVCLLYTRRGGIDICPARWSEGYAPEDVQRLIELTTFARSGIKQ